MFLYPSKVHGRLNRRSFVPESINGRVMCNPHYPNLFDLGDPDRPPLLPGTLAIDDSGAFQERDMVNRMAPSDALDRQLAHEQALRDAGCGPDFFFEAIITYDMLVGVDEALVDGKRVKRRGNRESAEVAVCETLDSALLYRKRRDEVQGAIAYAAQGADAEQYLECVEALLCLTRPGKDWLALGGFCIIGMQPTLKPLFAEVCRRVAPLARRAGVPRVHVLGVFADDCLAHMAATFAAEGIETSTDTSSIERNSINGKTWNAAHRSARGSPWCHVHKKDVKLVDYHPCDLTMDNLRKADAWCRGLPGGDLHASHRSTSPRPIAPFQATMF